MLCQDGDCPAGTSAGVWSPQVGRARISRRRGVASSQPARLVRLAVALLFPPGIARRADPDDLAGDVKVLHLRPGVAADEARVMVRPSHKGWPRALREAPC